MSEISPKIAAEAQICGVPLFQSKALFTTCRSIVPESAMSLKSIPSTASSASLILQPRCLSEESLTICKCPHVLVADDDPFQEFYYQTLFNRSMDFDSLKIERKDFRVKMLKSGEKLIEKLLKIQACGCQTPVLIITDYNMGEQNLNGVEVAINLRKLGCKATILLRTSEKKEDLTNIHRDLQELIKDKTIDCILDKGNHLETKNIVQEILKEKTFE